ncbi:MAG: hypothetical protein L3J63_12675, partial [Geopsychrobacter sp.]|nr:hypothetical protein [Geopsychrobacter sp.]
MTESFHNKHFPLGFHCGYNFWNRLDLSTQFRQTPPPGRTFLRQLIADGLHSAGAENLSAADLELLATINQVLLQIGQHFLRSRNCQIARQSLTTGNHDIELPKLEKVLQNFLQLFPALPVALGKTTSERFLLATEKQGQLNDLVLELFLLRVQSQNPALKAVVPLLLSEEQQLHNSTGYREQLQLIDQALPQVDDGFGQRPTSLLARLMEPLQQATSFREQLSLLQQTWGGIL